MVFQVKVNFPRIGLKSIGHVYGPSFIAATQSSYASQNVTPFSTNVASRFGKSGKSQVHNAFQPATHNSSNAVAKSDSTDPAGNDSGLEAYLAAWQNIQHNEGRDWTQFQFAKRIGWKPPTTIPEGKVKSKEDVVVVEVDEHIELATRPAGLERAYTTGQIQDVEKVLEKEAVQAEAAAIAQLDTPIAEEICNPHVEARPLTIPSGDASAVVEDSASVSQSGPSQSSPVSDSASAISSSASAAPSSEADPYVDHLTTLAARHQYAEIPAVFEAMVAEGVKQPAPAAYHALLSAAIGLTGSKKHQVVPRALDVYTDMLRRRVAPDTAIYTLLIELLATRSLDVLASKRALEEKRARFGGLDEERTFLFRSNAMEHDILAEDDSLSIAVKLFDNSCSSRAASRPLSSKTYGLLITACAERGWVNDMVRIYSHMESKKVVPHTHVFPPMIHAFAASGDLRNAVECYDEYRSLAIANDAGEIEMLRRDNDVYAAVVKAYRTCDRDEGGQKFLAKLEADLQESERRSTLQDTVGLKAFLAVWLKNKAFSKAMDFAAEKLSAGARTVAMAAICITAADSNNFDVATKAFESLIASRTDLPQPAMALLAMHVRAGDIDAAQSFWITLESSPATPQFIEPTTMHSIALVGSGHSERAMRQSRNMFARIRDSQQETKQAKTELVEQIDEAIETMGRFLLKRGIVLSPTASTELMWIMIENGGLVTPVAEHLLAGLGPDSIAQLPASDVNLLMQVQAGMILNDSTSNIAGAARFAYMLEVIVSRSLIPDLRTEDLIDKTLINLNRGDLTRLWHSYRYPVAEPLFSPVQYPSYSPAFLPATPAFDDSFDPYASSTDNKGSIVITDLLEKAHGRYSSHLNEALTKFRNIRRTGRHPRFFTYAKLIMAAAKEDRLNVAHEILAMAQQDVPLQAQYRVVRYGWVTILDAMVAACVTTGQRTTAAQYHQELLDMGAAPSANTFGLYITTLKESTKTFDEATEAVKIFLRAKSEGVEPSSFLYNALIGKLGKARRIDDCLFYFAEMRNLGIRPTSVTYGTIVNALCRVSDEKFAEELFEEMESMPNYKPRPAPYHSLMQFFLTTKRDRSKVLAFYERMRAKNIQPTMHTYKLLIDTHATLEPVDMNAAEAVLDEMRGSGEQPEAVHYASLIHAKGCVQHDIDGARRLFDTVVREMRGRPQPCLYQALFEAMVANHDVAATEEIIEDMRARRVEMTPYIANSLINGWAMAKNIDKAKAMFDAVEPAKREPSTYEAMARAFMTVEDRDSAMKVVNEALSRSYPAAVANKILELVGAWSRNSLTPLGIVVAAATATIHAIHPWSVFFALLVVFFLAGSAVTKVKHEVKARITHSSSGAPGGEGPRTHIQVLANSVVASVLVLLHAYKLSRERKSQAEQCWPRGSDVLVVGVVANYAAVAADTLSSELGILSSSPPRLLTSPTLRRVPPGTNGGVTATGLAAGLLGSFLIAATSVLLLPFCGPSPRLARPSLTGTAFGYDNFGWDLQSKLSFVLGITALGFCGSVLDSLLGGLLQASVTDTRTGKIIEGDGGKKVLVSGAGSMHQKQVAKVRRSHEEVEVVGAAAKKGGQEGRRVESGWDVLSNNGVNLVMACTMSMVGMVAASWIWGLPVGEMLT